MKKDWVRQKCYMNPIQNNLLPQTPLITNLVSISASQQRTSFNFKISKAAQPNIV